MNVVIVESPAKAKTINEYLGKEYKVMPSMGHVRDLPRQNNSVEPDLDFKMNWTIDAPSQKILNEIAGEVKKANKLILATDPDREGEAISWHVKEYLEDKKVLNDKEVQRVVFNAITKPAVLQAMEQPRNLDEPLVNAYLARRALDYLVGFTLSPVIWRKLPGARSAGRVQSVALRLICDREAEIESFDPQEYWLIVANLKSQEGKAFQARLVEYDKQKLGKLDVRDEKTASEIKTFLENGAFNVDAIDSVVHKRNPSPPFTTSTLQQEASRKLGFTASRTMRIAQKLYEGVNVDGETTGLITYMRTDGVQIAPEAVSDARTVIEQEFGGDYLPGKPRTYSTKAKNAQEAHEAIRPTKMTRHPKQLAKTLDSEQLRLYDLIWKRAVASQMATALIERTTVEVGVKGEGHDAMLRTTGEVIRFDGFLKLYQEGKDDEEDENNRKLPKLEKNEALDKKSVSATQHYTEPPSRYNEATLVKKLEELGIGRPSTYASTLQTLQDREYVTVLQKRLVPVDKGRIVTSFLESFFKRYVEFDFTANLEDQLDQISANKLRWLDVMSDFWREFNSTVDKVKEVKMSIVIDTLNDSLEHLIYPNSDEYDDPKKCPKCEDGDLSLKLSRMGSFVGCSNYPDCTYTRQLGNSEKSNSPLGESGQKVLGQDDNGVDILLRTGRYGPYVQLGEGEKPKRVPLPKNWALEDVDLEKGKQLISLPREIGTPPGSEHPITASIGRYGPFIVQNKVFVNLKEPDDLFTIGMNRAVDLIAEKANKKPGQWNAASALKDLGEHPDGGLVTVRNGRFGPYVNHGKINVTVPKDTDPLSITLEKAVEMIAYKVANPGKRRPRGRPKK